MFKRFAARLLCYSICFIYVNTIHAQLCNGSLGDPVVNITFGTVSQPLTAQQTNYRYNSDCPDDGEYTIAPAIPQCHAADNSWHPLTQDHTPNDVNGMMMVINASNDPGDFYVDTVRGLCSNTTYEFASWIINILAPGSICFYNGTVPNLTFSIENTDGSIIAKYNTGDITATSFSNWKQYGFYFTNSNNNDVVLRLTNNGNGGCGNDLALDDITFRPCGPVITASIKEITGSNTFNICQGNAASIVLQSEVSSDYASPAYQWQQSSDSGTTWTDVAGATALTLPVDIIAAAPVGSTQYRLAVGKTSNISIAQCRIVSNIINININETPSSTITSNSPVCIGKDIILTAHRGATYSWTGPNNFTSADSEVHITNAIAAYNGIYTVAITSAAGCSLTASTGVIVNNNPVAVAGEGVSICEGKNTQLQGSGGATYKWYPPSSLFNAGTANPVASPTDTTLYTLVVANEKGCTDTAYTTVSVWKKPVANAGKDKKMMAGDTVRLDGAASGTNIAYSWTPAANLTTAQVLQPVASPTQNTIYTLHVQSLQGCGMATDDVFVRVFKKVDIPNAFSPNSDGIHDTWVLKDIDTYPEADINVFNRYGQLLYKANGNSQPWDGYYHGKPLPVAAYYYVIDLKNGFPKLSGWVMLLK